MSTGEAGYWCIVPAAGRGRRFATDALKQYVPIGGKPLLLHTLEVLAAHRDVAGIVVVLAADDHLWPAGTTEIGGKPLRLATGGAERADSVRAGLAALPADVMPANFVLVHDAARPCLRIADITRLIEQASAAGGGLLAAPLRDTLKRADAGGRVLTTEPRESLWRALTPQMFRRAELEAALDLASASGVAITDEAMAMELAGHRPLLVEGAEDNIKVTTPADLALAEFLLARN
ncbi:MAG: 2-C-methyl-D-erythritol 4-phosphate cytidylyltransferase [Tahibacter sp.]